MSANDAARPVLGAPTVPAVTRLISQPTEESANVQRYAVVFSGQGKDYFFIWLRNVIYLVLTLGLYYPWARGHQLRYIYRHTKIARHHLDFTGEPKKMFRGFALTLALLSIYGLAKQFAPMASAIAGLLLLGLWPALLQGALQFRLANTTWQNKRMRFTGSLMNAYKVVLAPAGILLGVVAISAIAAVMFSQGSASVASMIVAVPSALCIYALIPYSWWRLKHYQHQHYALAQLQTTFRATAWDASKLFAKTVLVGLASAALALGICALMLGIAMASLPSGSSVSLHTAMHSMAPVSTAIVLVCQLIPFAYFKARSHELLWTNTGNPWLRFKASLPARELLGLLIRNGLLTVITLGLYWPFAYMAWIRAHLDAITIHTRLLPSQIATTPTPDHQQVAPGDAGLELIGLGVGT